MLLHASLLQDLKATDTPLYFRELLQTMIWQTPHTLSIINPTVFVFLQPSHALFHKDKRSDFLIIKLWPSTLNTSHGGGIRYVHAICSQIFTFLLPVFDLLNPFRVLVCLDFFVETKTGLRYYYRLGNKLMA